MATTTIRLPDELKLRLSDIAQRSGVSAHALILDAIAERVAAEEKHSAFVDLAEVRYDDFLQSGKSLSWDDMRAYLEGRARGERPTRPLA